MTVRIRVVDTDEDYFAWRQVRLAVLPNERADSIENLRAQTGSQQFLLAEVDGVLAGSGVVGKSDLAGSGAVAARGPSCGAPCTRRWARRRSRIWP